MMRDIAEKSVGWLVLGGIVLAVLVAKRRYEGKFAAAVAAADANARAEVRNELGVGQNVNVAVDASHNRGAIAHRCDDLFTCEICAPIALRVLMAGDRGRVGIGWQGSRDATRVNDDDHEYDSGADHGTVVRASGAGVGDNGGSGAGGRGAGGHAGYRVDLEGAPCASLSESSSLSDLPESDRNVSAGVPEPMRPTAPSSRDFLRWYSDMLERPWAYDESDPRCEVKRA